jgi:hypothetical protein
MNSVFVAYESAKSPTIRGDFIDRMHSRITVIGLVTILLIVVAKQYDGTAIACWLPAQFTEDQVIYFYKFVFQLFTFFKFSFFIYFNNLNLVKKGIFF